MADRTVTVSLIARVQGFVGGIATAKAATKDLSAEIDKLAVKHRSSFNDITRTTAIAGLALTGVFAAVVASSAGFDKQMSHVNAVLDKSSVSTQQAAGQLNALRDASIQAGKDTAFTATQAAQAEEELAKAGISTADILGGGLTGALNLASAGTISLADAAKYASQAMVEFNLHGKDVAHIADVLTSGANKSVTDVQGLGQALGQAGTVAHQAGLSLDETVGVLSLFAQHGLDGVEAGTTFKQMLLKLEGPSAKSAALMQSLGLTVYDTQGNFKSAAGLAATLQDSLGGLSQQERNAALNTIFGSRAVRGAIDLYNAGAKGVNDWTLAVGQSGTAQQTAALKLDNLSGDVKKLEGSLQALAITSSGGATSGLRSVTKGATGLVNEFTSLPGWIQATTVDLAGISGVSLLAMSGFLKAKGTLSQFKDSLAEMGPIGKRASGALSGLTKWGGYAAVAGVAVFGIVELFKYMSRAGQATKLDIDGVTSSLQQFALTGQATGQLAKTFGNDLGGVTEKVQELQKATSELAVQKALPQGISAGKTGQLPSDAFYKVQALNLQINQLTQNFHDLDAALAQEAGGGDVKGAAANFSALRTQLEASGMGIQAINALFPQYRDAASKAAAANVGVAQGFASVKQQANLMSLGLQDAIDHGETLLTVFKELNGAAINATQTDIDFRNSLATLSAAVEKNIKAHDKNAHSLSLNTQSGRDNVSMILDSIDKANKSAEAVYEQTNSVDDANTAWNNQIKALQGVLDKLGFTPAQIQAVIDKYAKMPPVVSTQVEAPGLIEANDTATGYARILNDLDGRNIHTTVSTKYSQSGSPPPSKYFKGNRWGGAYEHAADGLLSQAHIASPVSGPGARYAYAEGGTGGELFVPHNGDYARSIGLLAKGAAWYGQMLVPAWRGGVRGGDGAAAGVTYHSEMNVYAQNADPAILGQYQRVMEIQQRAGRR